MNKQRHKRSFNQGWIQFSGPSDSFFRSFKMKGIGFMMNSYLIKSQRWQHYPNRYKNLHSCHSK